MTPAVWLVVLFACDAEPDDVRFNSDDLVEVRVTASTEVGDAVTVDLTSNTGAVVVGTGSVTPGSGPVGTLHDVSVVVADEFEDLVVRAIVITDAGERGVEEVALTQDSADSGLWWRQVTSVGTDGEERTDTFTFALFSASEDTDANGILP